MNFQDAVKVVLAYEGGGQIVSHPRDPGRLTKYGISLKSHPTLGETGIRYLSEEDAIDIYRKDYWNPLRLSRFSPRLSLPLFDAAVNHGIRSAGKIFQQALNRLGADLVVDGILGEKTLKASKSYSPRRVLSAFLLERLHFYRTLENYDVFGTGWDRRIIELAIES